jgi:hypothetical protein
MAQPQKSKNKPMSPIKKSKYNNSKSSGGL